MLLSCNHYKSYIVSICITLFLVKYNWQVKIKSTRLISAVICLTGHDQSLDRFGGSLTGSENLTGQPDRANPEFASNGFIHLSASHVRI